MKRLCYTILYILLPFAVYSQQDTARSIFADTMQLGEVVISVKTKVLVHGDTTSYRADSFITDPLASTEDVLKRLPGVEVSRDGKVTIQGKEVNKIFINGKEYFADDIRGVIQNLPAEIIEKIQVADWRDEDAQFAGNKENTAEKIINLQLKEKYNGGMYGRVAAGYGNKNRYQGGLFANYMDGEALRLTVMGNANNTGMADVTNDRGGDVNNTSWRNPGVQTAQKGSVNFSYDNDKKIQLNGSYSLDNNDNFLQRSSYRTTYLPAALSNLPGDSLLLQQQDNEQRSGGLQHSVHLRSKIKFNKNTSLRSNLNLRQSGQENTAYGDDITYNADASSINFRRQSVVSNDRQNSSVSLSNSFMKRFNKKGRTLLVNLNAGYSGNKTNGDNTNNNIYYTTQTSNEVKNLLTEKGNSFNTNLGFKYTEPINEHNSISLNYNNLYTNSNNTRNVAVASNHTYITDTNQSRGYKNINGNNKIGIAYQYSDDKLTGGIGFDAEPYSRKSLRTTSDANDISQSGVNYFPRLFARYSVSKASSVELGYDGGIAPPSIDQLQPIPDYTDSLNIFTGNPQLRPEINNSIRLRYHKNNVHSGRSMWINLNTRWTNSKIVNNTELTGSTRTTTPVNADGNYTLASSVNYTEPVIKKLLTATFSANAAMNNNITIVNGRLQKIANYTIAPTIRLTSYSGKWYEGSLVYSYRWNKVEGSSQNNNLAQTHDLTHDGTFILPAGFRCSYYVSYLVNKGLAQNFQQNFFLANVMVDKKFSKPRGLSLRIQAFDVFNNYPTVQRNIADNYYEDVSVNRIGSYLMFSMIYKFISFPMREATSED